MTATTHTELLRDELNAAPVEEARKVQQAYYAIADELQPLIDSLEACLPESGEASALGVELAIARTLLADARRFSLGRVL